MNNIIDKLLNSVREQTISSPDVVLEIESAIKNQKHRQAFLLINNLKEKNLWKPNAEEEKLLESFWWEFAN